MRLLLAGFEPFGGRTINPSEQVVRALAQETLEATELVPVILPVDYSRGPSALIRAYQESQPDAVLCLGQASRRTAISIERIAINLLDYRLPDNAGRQMVDEPIVRDGPAAYFTTLPVRAMFNAVRACGVPAELSLSAGSYLCNHVTFALLHYLAKNNLKTPAGFVHLPALPEQALDKNPSIPSMGLTTMLQGIRAAISAIQEA